MIENGFFSGLLKPQFVLSGVKTNIVYNNIFRADDDYLIERKIFFAKSMTKKR